LIVDFLELPHEIGLKLRLLGRGDAGKAVVVDTAAELEPSEQVGVEMKCFGASGFSDDRHDSSPKHITAFLNEDAPGEPGRT
jgi:hypothetical protein